MKTLREGEAPAEPKSDAIVCPVGFTATMASTGGQATSGTQQNEWLEHAAQTEPGCLSPESTERVNAAKSI